MLSVIVPCFNVDKYVGRCLISLAGQSYKNCQYILINDGSTDETGEILRYFSKLLPNCTLVEQPNFGYGKTINKGISLAKGEYFTIVESDDILPVDAFEKLVNEAMKVDADWARGNFCFYRAKDDCRPDVEYVNFISKFRITGVPFYPFDYPDIFVLRPTVWSGIYRTRFVRDHKIKLVETEGASYQDLTLIFKLLAANPKMITIPEIVYYYRQHPEQSINSPAKYNALQKAYDNLLEHITSFRSKQVRQFLRLCLVRKSISDYYWSMGRVADKPKMYAIAAAWFKKKIKIGKLLVSSQALEPWETEAWKLFVANNFYLYKYYRPLKNGLDKLRRIKRWPGKILVKYLALTQRTGT